MSYKQKPRVDVPIIYPARLQTQIDLYDKANIVYPISNEDRNEMQLEDAIRLNPKSLRSYIVSIYRFKTQKQFVIDQSTDDVLVYYLQRTAQRFNGSEVQDNRPIGYFWNPTTRAQIDATGAISKYVLSKLEPYFTIPFSPEKVDEIINMSMIDVNQFYVAVSSNSSPEITANNQKFQIRNKADFKNGSFDELMDMGKYNYTATESRLDAWRLEGKSIRKQTQNLNILTQNTTTNKA